MGEYARFRDQSVKIGTCEEMYYLRYDQRHLVWQERGSLDPNRNDVACELRFRFPWPDEDGTEPGGFDAYERSLAIRGVPVPEGVEHGTVQFVAHAGYVISLPCPEGLVGATAGLTAGAWNGVTIHRNGFSGAVHLCQQKPTPDGKTLRAIFKCGGCGAKWRAETWTDVEPYIVALRSEGDRRAKDGCGDFYHRIADRLADGYPEGRAALVVA